ncbi:NACHT domain-containing protein [Kitasatospora sp. NPDC096128]|uniref:NACHT domain-containing protein n=1 Tax=Kitasatospora sp. NPDC096128 TaxID=3155547 RepID=UPI0033258C06
MAGTKNPIDTRCNDSGTSCSTVQTFVWPLLSVALATTLFVFYRYVRIRRPIVRKAKRRPQQLVSPAGIAVERIVGREQLCQVICRSLGDHQNRRPYILVGGVGSGKTAVLIQLTQMLAQQGRVPVPIRLRRTDPREGLDFRELAREVFADESDPGALLSSEQSAKVWRQLCKDGRAVVVADGLEEALTSGGRQGDRDNVIRGAIDRAERQNLPLVIASRPHTPLEETYASIINLEPLSEEAALSFLARDDPEPDTHRLDWIVETAKVSESPLYMELTKELAQHHLLEHLKSAKSSNPLNTRSRDRSTLRLWLLDTWKSALISGHLREDVALTRTQREESIHVLSALATMGLLQDHLEVHYAELFDPKKRFKGRENLREAAKALLKRLGELVPDLPLRDYLEDSRRDRDRTRDRASLYALHASRGEQLGLVEARGDRVLFPHSILQAYLGSEFLDELGEYLPELLVSEDLGRELLISLALRACRDTTKATENIAHMLMKAANQRTDSKALDLYATALEVDLHAPGAKPKGTASKHDLITDFLRERWSAVTTGDQRSLDEARERLIHRYGEVMREITRLQGLNPPRWPEDGPPPAYTSLLQIAFKEKSYALRLAIVQELGAGGDAAFDALRTFFRRSTYVTGSDPVKQYHLLLADEQRWGQKASDDAVRALDEPTRQKARMEADAAHEARQGIWRQFAIRASVVPMIVGSVGPDRRDEAAERLRLWLQHLDPGSCPNGRADLPLAFEVALAQGFKGAANRRRRHPNATDETRELLIEQAETMLARSRYWFAQLTLIHALCLWELPDRPDRPDRSAVTEPDAEESADRRGRRPATDPHDAVERWLRLVGSERAPTDHRDEDQTRRGERLHPFVARAADLAVLALETGRPEQYLWIDEKGAMEKVGSASGDPQYFRKHNLWIPPSVGWSILDPRAQQLLADVLLLLNLTERNDDPDAIEDRLVRSNRNSLPPCLTKDRSPLQPRRTVGMAYTAEPGNTCLRDCPFELCPYPPKGDLPRAELQEMFCLQQQALLRWRRGRFYALTLKRAPWQGMTCKELRHFWGQMAERTRKPRP